MSKSHGAVRVTVAIPSEDESARLFGVSLAREGIQPVWLEIENGGETPFYFAPLGVDPDYFTPLEAANRVRRRCAPSANQRMRQHFLRSAIKPEIGSRARVSGFVFTNLDRGVKGINVELIGRSDYQHFFFFLDVPGLRADYKEVDFWTLYAPEEFVDVDEAGLRRQLEAMPCCATTADGRGVEDPLNFVLIGEADEVFPNFVRTGWHVTEVLHRGAAMRTFLSYFFGRAYRYAPISPIFALGRAQDLSLQKSRATARERNHLRLWLAPLRFEGKPVWLGQISRDIGLSFSWKTIVGHEVDPDLDEARNYLVQDMIRSKGLVKFGWVGGVGATPADAPRHMADGAPFFTDGRRAVMLLDDEPTPIFEIQRFGWEGYGGREPD